MIILQAASAFFILLRMLVIIKLGGVGSFGIFSVIATIITFLTIPCQFLNNQRIQVVLVKLGQVERRSMLNAGFVVSILLSSIASLLVFTLGPLYKELNNFCDFRLWSCAVASAVIFSFFSNCCELKALSESRLVLYYVIIAISSFFGFASSLILLNMDVKYVVFIPSFYFAASSLSYIIYNLVFLKDTFWDFESKANYRTLLLYVKESWSLSIIPFYNTLLDFSVRTLALSWIGALGLGYFQTIVSVEAMIGNIFLSGFYKKTLINTTNGVAFNFKNVFKAVLVFTTIPVLGILLLNAGNLLFHFKHAIFDVVVPLILVCLLRFPWNIWGAIGQALIVYGRYRLVSRVEVLTKTLVSGIFLGLAFFYHFDVYGYVLAVACSSILMWWIVVRTSALIFQSADIDL